MREVTLTWEEASLAKTDLVELIDVVDGLTFVANLHITPEGVRQVVLPSYKEGKTVDDLDQIPYVEVEQHLDDRNGEGSWFGTPIPSFAWRQNPRASTSCHQPFSKTGNCI